MKLQYLFLLQITEKIVEWLVRSYLIEIDWERAWQLRSKFKIVDLPTIWHQQSKIEIVSTSLIDYFKWFNVHVICNQFMKTKNQKTYVLFQVQISSESSPMSQIRFFISQWNSQHLDTSPWFRLLPIHSSLGFLGPTYSQQNHMAG